MKTSQLWGRARRPVLVILCTAAAAAPSLLPAGAAQAASGGPTSIRFAGNDRYQTAEMAGCHTEVRSGYSGCNGAITPGSYFIVASGLGFSDALVSSYLAGAYGLGTPILLTDNSEISPPVVDFFAGNNHALACDKPKVVVVDGGQQISDHVVTEIQNAVNCPTSSSNSGTVTRIHSGDAFTTAATVATTPGLPVGAPAGFGRTAVVASGDNFPDALAASPAAYQEHLPILLTHQDSLPSQTQQALQQLKPQTVFLMGGTAAVSSSVSDQITSMGISVYRVAGATRQETATDMATIETTKLDWSTGSVLLSRGDTFPDSLSGGALAGIDEQPILLTDDPSDLGTPAANYLQANSGAIIGVAALGGTSALTDDVWHQALNDADDQSASVRTYTMER